MNELIPCPFCNEAVTLAEAGADGYHFWYYISHQGRGSDCRVFMESGLCAIDFPKSAEEEKMKLIKAWNRTWNRRVEE